MDRNEIESKIQEAGLDGPRVTPSDVQDEILAALYHVFPGTTLTVCALVLKNGFVVTGESAAASPENFNEELGREIARKKAEEKIWPLLGYRLRDALHELRQARTLHRDAGTGRLVSEEYAAANPGTTVKETR